MASAKIQGTLYLIIGPYLKVDKVSSKAPCYKLEFYSISATPWNLSYETLIMIENLHNYKEQVYNDLNSQIDIHIMTI